MNTQRIEKPVHDQDSDDGNILDVHSVFLTIQGEGPLAGHPAVFVRLAGCNLQCPSCDTEYTGPRRSKMLLNQVISKVRDAIGVTHTTRVVITGGEPFRQDIGPLSHQLIKIGLSVQVETNGTLAPSAGLHRSVMVVCSPKTGKMNAELEQRLNALKYVVKAGDIGEDGLPLHALDHTCGPAGVAKPFDVQKTRPFIPIYIQPQDDKDASLNEANMRAAVKSCIQHGYRLGVQMHKYANIE